MLTIIQFLSAVQTFIQFLRVKKYSWNNGLENSYQPIPRFVCTNNIEALIPRALSSGFVLLYCIQTTEVGLHKARVD